MAPYGNLLGEKGRWGENETLTSIRFRLEMLTYPETAPPSSVVEIHFIATLHACECATTSTTL